MRFFIGLDRPGQAARLPSVMLSATTLRHRRSAFAANDWILDSGAFTTIARFGGYPEPVEVYAELVRKFATCGSLLAAVAQDFMCEPHMLERTGGTVASHQSATIERFDALRACELGAYLMPVLQGYEPLEYAAHVRAYGARLEEGAWVGVGSVCKRQGRPEDVAAVLLAIHRERPDLRLHGFGVKKTSLADPLVRALLHSADSFAWSYRARREGRYAHDLRDAEAYRDAILGAPVQATWVFP